MLKSHYIHVHGTCSMCVCTCMCILFVSMCVRVYVYIHAYKQKTYELRFLPAKKYTCIYVCMHDTYVCIYDTYIRTHTHTQTKTQANIPYNQQTHTSHIHGMNVHDVAMRIRTCIQVCIHTHIAHTHTRHCFNLWSEIGMHTAAASSSRTDQQNNVMAWSNSTRNRFEQSFRLEKETACTDTWTVSPAATQALHNSPGQESIDINIRACSL
jgi:hypothetical protein